MIYYHFSVENRLKFIAEAMPVNRPVTGQFGSNGAIFAFEPNAA